MMKITLLVCLFLAIVDWFINRKYYSQDGHGSWQDTNNQLRNKYWQSKAQIKEYDRLMRKVDTVQGILWLKMSIMCNDFVMDTIRQLIGEEINIRR